MLESKRVPAIAIAFACLLSLPSLKTGWLLDDVWHRAMLTGGATWAPFQTGWTHLFEFATGTPEENADFIEKGFGPWWITPGLRISFLRPLSCLSHALDYALWPKSGAMMHAHSILWYAALLAVLSIAFRRWLPPLVANLAILLYAIDPAHGLPVSWLANRNALIAATFAFGALVLWDMNKRWLAAAAFALAIGSGESAIAILGFFVAHWVFLKRRPLREFAPLALVVVTWMVVYHAGNYGVKGSGVYCDPRHAPLAYAGAVLAHVPILAAVELGAPPPDGFPFYVLPLKLLFVAIAVGFLAWAFKVAPKNRTMGFFALGAILALLPGSAALPSSRLLLIPGFGLLAILATVCAEATTRAARTFRGVALFSHVLLAPLLFFGNVNGMVIVDHMLREYGKGVPVDGSASDKRLVLVNAPDTAFIYYLIVNPIEDGLHPPSKMLTMAANRRDLTFTRTAAQVFTLREEDGFFRDGTETLFSDPSRKWHRGEVIEQSDTRITITHVLADGTPDEAQFELTKPLDHYVFREWRGKALVPLELPAIGESVTFEGRMPDIL